MNNYDDDFMPPEWQDDSLYVETLEDVEVPDMVDENMEGVTDGTVSTDIAYVEDITNTDLQIVGEETFETYETEPATIADFAPVTTYHYDEDGDFVVDLDENGNPVDPDTEII